MEAAALKMVPIPTPEEDPVIDLHAPAPESMKCTLDERCDFVGSWAAFLDHAPRHPLPHPDDRKAWLTSRQTFVGASEVAAACGFNPWSGPLEVWSAKISPKQEPPFTPIPVEGGGMIVMPRDEVGQFLERHLLDNFAKRHGIRYVQPATKRHQAHPCLAATPDADVIEGSRTVPTGTLVQVKEVGWRVAPSWDEGIPIYTLIQVQAEMEVWDRDRCIVLAQLGTEIREYVVERDPELIAPCVEIVTDLWNYVRERLAPIDFDLSHTRDETLRRLWPSERAGMAVAEEDVIKLAQAYASERAMEKAAKDEKERLGTQLKAIVGDRAGLWWGRTQAKPLGKVTWTSNDDGLDKAALTEELLARIDSDERKALEKKFTKAGARVLRVTLK